MPSGVLFTDDGRRARLARKKELAEGSLRSFVRQAWHVVEPATAYQHNWHIDAICEHLEACSAGQIRKLAINIPPRTMKSLTVSVFWPCWRWIQSPATRWLFSSYAERLSLRDSIKCRDILLSNWYQDYWRDRFKLKWDQNQKSRFDNDKTGFRLATTIGGVGTGEGGDVIVVDDPHNVTQSESDAKREAVIDWWDGSMSTRGNNPDTVCFVVVMQRVHQVDLCGHLLTRGDYEHLCLPMEYDPKRSRVTSLGWQDPRREEGELLWPDRFKLPFVAALKTTLGSYQAAGQLDQNPVPRGGAIFSSERFRYFRELPLPADGKQKAMPGGPASIFELHVGDGSVRRHFAWECRWFQTVDTASKTNQHNDYTVVGTFCLTPDNDLLVYEIARDKLPVPKQFGWIVSFRIKYPWLEFQAIEDTSAGTGLIQSGAASGIGFRSVHPGTRDKVTLAQSVATMYENHKVFHRQGSVEEPTPWLVEYEHELIRFPKGEHDDQVDVTSYAGQLAVQDNLQKWTRITRPIIGSERRRPSSAETIDEAATERRDDVTTDKSELDTTDPVTELLKTILVREAEREDE